MASFQAHCEETGNVPGKSYAEVHVWLDEFFLDKPLGGRHRRKRHHEQGVQGVVRLFDEDAGIAARMHMVTDLKEEGWTELDKFPKNEKDYVEMGLF